MSNLKKIIEKLNDELETVIATVWKSAGLKSDSDAIKSINIETTSNGLAIYAVDYVKYISSGRRKFARKVPISDIIIFIKKRGLTPKGKMSLNNLAFAIQNEIYKNGIKGKNFLKSTEKIIDKTIQPELESGIFELLQNRIKIK